MKKSVFLRVIAMVLAMIILVGCSPKDDTKDPAKDQSQQTQASSVPTGEKQEHRILVTDEKNAPVANVGVYVYTDQTQSELVWFDTTNAEGVMTFTEVPSETFAAVLSDVPEQYTAQEVYALTGLETTIVLEGYKDPEYKLGDKMEDFTVTDSEGDEYSLYDLLKTKDAVVLNFWYINCGPCGMEFPYMNEAYQDYRDDLEILAMSPIDVNRDIANYKEQNLLTFPMAECEQKWEQMMQVKAYPTTVVVDRNGIISFIHQGYIDNVEDFKKIFDFFTDEEYVPTLVKDLSELPEVEEEEKGTKENPFEIGGVTSFEITVKPGQDFYLHLYKTPNMWMQIKANDLSVVYDEKTYTAKNGSVAFLVNTPDMNSFVELVFSSQEKEEKTYTVTLSPLPGSFNNPYPLEMGENTVQISGGNEQGCYYVFYAKEDGTLSLECTSAPAGVGYDCVLNRVMAGDVVVVRSLSENGEEGSVSTQVRKGESVKINFSTMPDSNNTYPGGTFIYNAAFTAGEVDEEEENKGLEYLVTVQDEEGKGIANVNMSVTVEEEEKTFSTNAEGVGSIRLPKGSYTVKFIVPEGYTAETTELTLTEETPTATVVLKVETVEMVDYQVKVENVYAEPVSGVMVRIDSQMLATDENGVVKVNLKKGTYTATVMTVPAGFVKPAAVALPEDGTEQTVITLQYQPGTEHAPIEVTQIPYTTQSIPAGTGLYYNLRNAGGMILLIESKDAAVIFNGTTYGATADGYVIVFLPKPVMPNTPTVLQVLNVGTAAKTFTLQLHHPVGSFMNPKVLSHLTDLETALEANAEEGFYYSWTANESGMARFSLLSATNDARADICLTNTTTSVSKTLSADGTEMDDLRTVDMEVQLGDTLLIQVIADPYDENGAYVGHPETVVSIKSALITEPVDTRITYTVTVTDENGQPWLETLVTFKKGTVTVGEPVRVDANGVASALLEPGDYSFELTLPDASKIYDVASCVLTEEAPAKTVVLQPKPDTTLDYTVNITKDGAAYTGEVTVQLLDGQGNVIAEGAAVSGIYTERVEGGTYTVQLVLADENLEYTAVTVTKEAPTATVELTEKVVVPADVTYTVKVLDSDGAGQSGVWVQIKDTEYLGQTDANGVFTQTMPAGKYSVELIFSGTSYYYNTASAILTAAAPNLTITLAAEPNAGKTLKHWFLNDAPMYILDPGTTHVQLGLNKAYSDGTKYCYFGFAPGADGSYRVTIDRTELELVNYGTTIFSPAPGESSNDSEDGSIYITVYEDSIKNYEFVFAVEADSGITDAAVTITRVGDPGLRIDQIPNDEAWKSDYVPTAFSLPSGSKLTYVDVMGATENAVVVYNESDGFYHWRSADGPIMYMNLGVNAPYYSLTRVINGDGVAGGAPIRAYFFAEDGTFLKKEEYTDTLISYIACIDKTTGVYPLTKELAYMIQNGCKEWWTATDPGYGMSALNGSNPEIAWLFACCYIAD